MEVWALMIAKDSHCLQASLSHPRFQGGQEGYPQQL